MRKHTPGRVSDFPEVTQLVNGREIIWTQMSHSKPYALPTKLAASDNCKGMFVGAKDH